MKPDKTINQNRTETWRNFLTGISIGVLIAAAVGITQRSILIGVITGIPISIAIGLFLDRRLPLMKFPAHIFRRILFSIVLFVVMLNSILFLPEAMVEKWKTLLYLPAAFAWLLVVFFVFQAVASLDEMQRRIQTEAIAIGFAGTAVIAMAYGIAALVFDIPTVNWIYLLVVMMICWLIGKVWTLRRYGS